jgi:four helix bundle protein
VASIKRIEDIQSWQAARRLVHEVYCASGQGALGKDFGLRDQIRRAAVSCMSNIAEGFSRKSDRDFAHFLDIARGSAIEVQSLLYVALDVGHIPSDEFSRLHGMAEDAVKLIGAFTSYLRRSSYKGS